MAHTRPTASDRKRLNANFCRELSHQHEQGEHLEHARQQQAPLGSRRPARCDATTTEILATAFARDGGGSAHHVLRLRNLTLPQTGQR